MTTTRTQAIPCPSCGKALDAATSVFDDAVPRDGDVSICFACGHIMVFEGGVPRNPTDTEMPDIAGDPRIIKLQRARGKVLRQKP
jgi:hypothetical protein